MAKQPQNLVGRTFRFAQAVRAFVNRLPRVVSNYEDMRQVERLLKKQAQITKTKDSNAKEIP
jgi:hypothetical protein